MSAMNVSNISREAMKQMLKEGTRINGTKPFDVADISVELGVSNTAEGSARVKLGKTDVVVGVKINTGEPYPDSPDRGNLIVSADLLPMASPRFESGPPKFHAIELPRLVDRMLRESGLIDFDKLCIKKGENVWNLFVDIYPINDDGALIDAAGIGAIAALRNAVFPGINEHGKADYKKRSKDKLPLSKETTPISFTFYKLDDNMLIHPTREEEEACEGKIVWGISKWKGQYMINSCQKGKAQTFTTEEIKTIMELLPKKYEEVMKQIGKSIEKA